MIITVFASEFEMIIDDDLILQWKQNQEYFCEYVKLKLKLDFSNFGIWHSVPLEMIQNGFEN